TRPAIAASVSTRDLLERGGGDERLRRQRRLCDAEQQRRSVGGFAAAVHHLLVLLHDSRSGLAVTRSGAERLRWRTQKLLPTTDLVGIARLVEDAQDAYPISFNDEIH